MIACIQFSNSLQSVFDSFRQIIIALSCCRAVARSRCRIVGTVVGTVAQTYLHPKSTRLNGGCISMLIKRSQYHVTKRHRHHTLHQPGFKANCDHRRDFVCRAYISESRRLLQRNCTTPEPISVTPEPNRTECLLS